MILLLFGTDLKELSVSYSWMVFCFYNSWVMKVINLIGIPFIHRYTFHSDNLRI